MDFTEEVPENLADFISPTGPNGALSCQRNVETDF